MFMQGSGPSGVHGLYESLEACRSIGYTLCNAFAFRAFLVDVITLFLMDAITLELDMYTFGV